MADVGPPVAEHVSKDLKSLLLAFFCQRDLSYGRFKSIWAQRSMSHIHHVIPSQIDRDAFNQLCFDIVLRMTHEVDSQVVLEQPFATTTTTTTTTVHASDGNDVGSSSSSSSSSSSCLAISGSSSSSASHSAATPMTNTNTSTDTSCCLKDVDEEGGRSILWNIGVVYALYTLYATQVTHRGQQHNAAAAVHTSGRSLINISPEFHASLRLALEQVAWLGDIGRDAVALFDHLVRQEAFVFGLCTGPVTPWGATRWEKLGTATLAHLDKAIRCHRALVAKKEARGKVRASRDAHTHTQAAEESSPACFTLQLQGAFGPHFGTSSSSSSSGEGGSSSSSSSSSAEEQKEQQEQQQLLREQSILATRRLQHARREREAAAAAAAAAKHGAVTQQQEEEGGARGGKIKIKIKNKNKAKAPRGRLNVPDTVTAITRARRSRQQQQQQQQQQVPVPVAASAGQEEKVDGESEESVSSSSTSDDDDDDDDDDDSHDAHTAMYVTSQEQKRRRLQEHFDRLNSQDDSV